MIKYLTNNVDLTEFDKKFLKDDKIKEFLINNDLLGAVERLDKISSSSISFSKIIKELVLKCNFSFDYDSRYKVIHEGMFYNIDVSNVNIPQNIKHIESGSFVDCRHLSSVAIENENIIVENRAFEDCIIDYLYVPKSIGSNETRKWMCNTIVRHLIET